MRRLIEKWIVRLWNRRAARHRPNADARALDLGIRAGDDGSSGHVTIPQAKRAEHLAILGKTGSGKSYLLRHIAQQDIAASRGFLCFDFHGDTTDFVVRSVADQEMALDEDLSGRLIVVRPADTEYSVGMNPLESRNGAEQFVRIAEFAQVLRERWHLDTFGARTDELLRNALYVLADARLTLLELGPLLNHAAFRAACLAKVENDEVKQYFALRFDPLSEAMQAVMREPILNKTSAFTADPHFRHIVGQARSTFSLIESVDAGHWIVLDLHKGSLGEQSATLGALFFTAIKNALFARRKRDLFTIFADEMQNLISFSGGDLETILSEARKFAVSVACSTQFQDQLPPEVRAAIMAVGSHVFFQLSGPDTHQVASALDGGKPLQELLKNLPRRHMVVKSGHARYEEAVVPMLRTPKSDPADLYARSRARWARKRTDVEADIRERQATVSHSAGEVLHDWE